MFKFRAKKKPKPPSVLALLTHFLTDRNGFGVVPRETPCPGGTAWGDIEIVTLDAAMNLARLTNIEIDVGQMCIRTLTSPSPLAAPSEGGINENDRITSHRLCGTDQFAGVLSAVRRAINSPFSCTAISQRQVELWTQDPSKNVWNRNRLALLEALGDSLAVKFDFQRSVIVVHLRSEPVRQVDEAA